MIAAALLHRPIYGGVFGAGRYRLASMPCLSNGLHAVRFMVIEPTGAVISIAEDKRQALCDARRALRAAGRTNDEPANDPHWLQCELWPDKGRSHPPIEPPLRKISRRRREIFEKSAARCHYCKTVLTLDGKWHVEHMVPRALGGTDDLVNLVAACASCNLAKSDKTAVEFAIRQFCDGP